MLFHCVCNKGFIERQYYVNYMLVWSGGISSDQVSICTEAMKAREGSKDLFLDVEQVTQRMKKEACATKYLPYCTKNRKRVDEP